MKTSSTYVWGDIDSLAHKIEDQYKEIGANSDDIYENQARLGEGMLSTIKNIGGAQQKCVYAEEDIRKYRESLVLYCQQFAFAPDMNKQCQALLDHKETALPFIYFFGGQAPYQADVGKSSHGMELNVSGGNIQVADWVDPEIAAAAVNPNEAVLQVDGKTIIAPFSAIDPSKVELACDENGCCLIPDDGNPENDIYVRDLVSLDVGHDTAQPLERAPMPSNSSQLKKIPVQQFNQGPPPQQFPSGLPNQFPSGLPQQYPPQDFSSVEQNNQAEYVPEVYTPAPY